MSFERLTKQCERYDQFERKLCKGCPAIEDGSKVQQLVADFLEIGLSITGATDLINQTLHQAGLPTVSRSAVTVVHCG